MSKKNPRRETIKYPTMKKAISNNLKFVSNLAATAGVAAIAITLLVEDTNQILSKTSSRPVCLTVPIGSQTHTTMMRVEEAIEKATLSSAPSSSMREPEPVRDAIMKFDG
jgi:hypothetical protein